MERSMMCLNRTDKLRKATTDGKKPAQHCLKWINGTEEWNAEKKNEEKKKTHRIVYNFGMLKSE